MPATVENLNFKDAGNTTRPGIFLNISGNLGYGPYAPFHGLVTKAGDPVDSTHPLHVQLTNERTETLWTDDTGAYFVRTIINGVLSWLDISGNVVSAPGTGAQPVASQSVSVDVSRFVATAGGTGYSTGDLINHVVIYDVTAGTVIANFWINTTTNLKLASAPSSGNITATSTALAAGAATSAKQDAQIAALSATSIVTGQAAPTSTSASLVAARTGRKNVLIQNLSNIEVFVGPAGVSTTTGVLVPAGRGGGIVIEGGAAVHAVTATGTTGSVSYMETY